LIRDCNQQSPRILRHCCCGIELASVTNDDKYRVPHSVQWRVESPSGSPQDVSSSTSPSRDRLYPTVDNQLTTLAGWIKNHMSHRME